MKLICKDTLKKPNRKSLKNIGVFGAQTLKLATLEVLQFLLKKEAFWAAKPLQFPTDHPCHAFYQDNRLIAVQVWFGRGGTSLIVYSIYGISGSRWETHKKAYLHKLLKSIELDRIARGQIPCVLLGDFNLEIAESQVLSQALSSNFWYDLRTIGDKDNQQKATCNKGQGSYIDHIFVSPALFDQCFNFQVRKFKEFKDHSVLSSNISVQKAA